LLIAAACICWGIDNNLTRKISGSDPVQIAALKGLVAGLVNLAIALWQGSILPPISVIALCGLLGLAGYGLSLVLFVLALRHLGSARTGAYYSVAPFVGAAAAIAIFQEPVTLRLVGAALLMGFGVYLHLAESHEHEHLHEAVDHEHRHVHDEHHRHEHGPSDPSGEPHTHVHQHQPMRHKHPHYPDLHHHHGH
jgi:drug/metabolite transporter (DMT)-like permease